MTIMERIPLHKLGYSKEEINQLAADKYNPAGLTDPPAPDPEPEPEPAAPDPVPENNPAAADNSAVLAAIKDLTAALQANAIKTQPQPEQPKESAEDALFTILK